jgi:hypothetical protein
MLNNLLPQQEPPMTPQLTSIHKILAAGAARGKQMGRRAKELGVVNYGSWSEHFQNLLRKDTKELLGFLSTTLTAAAANGGLTWQNPKLCPGSFLKRKNKNNPHSITYLAKAWGVGKNFPLLQNVKKGKPCHP